MSVKTTEYCDCCGRSLHYPRGENIYRGRFRRFWFWWHAEPKGDVTVCGDCWDGIGKAVREHREGTA